MPKITRDQVRVPADVMPESRDEYIENFMKATRGTGRLMLFACDQIKGRVSLPERSEILNCVWVV